MKKFIFALVFVLILGGGVYYYLNSISDDENPEGNSFEGILAEQQANDSYAGSHLLIGEKGEVITPLRSLLINLSGNNYLNNKVRVIGKANIDDNVFEVEGISILEVIDPSKANRKFVEYENLDLGFEIKYYSDWKVSEVGNEVIFLSPSENDSVDLDKVVISQSPSEHSGLEWNLSHPEGLEISPPTPEDILENALRSYAEKNNHGDFLSISEKAGKDKILSLKIVGEGENIDYIFYRSGFVYKVSFVESLSGAVAENKNIFNEMLSEFKFKDEGVEEIGEDNSADDTEDSEVAEDLAEAPLSHSFDYDSENLFDFSKMAAFESSIYHFSAKYPKDWYYAGKRGEASDVLHHYGFSDSAIDESTVELVSLDIMASHKDNTQSLSNSILTAYVNVDGRTYRVSGNESYKDIILAIATSITSLSAEGAQ